MLLYFTIFINGDPFNCDSSMSLSDVLSYLSINIDSIIIEYNKDLINKNQFDYIYFESHDCIEIISIVGGG